MTTLPFPAPYLKGKKKLDAKTTVYIVHAMLGDGMMEKKEALG